jgi:hypothetical protein
VTVAVSPSPTSAVRATETLYQLPNGSSIAGQLLSSLKTKIFGLRITLMKFVTRSWMTWHCAGSVSTAIGTLFINRAAIVVLPERKNEILKLILNSENEKKLYF